MLTSGYMHKETEKFYAERADRIASFSEKNDASGKELTRMMFEKKIMYNFDWMGRPIIQLPGEIVVMQELIWEVKPDLIIETGIAHGGSLIFSASQLAMLDYCEAIRAKKPLNTDDPRRRVLGIDIDIREHNRREIESHPMSNRIDMIEGSSISAGIIEQVHRFAGPYERILVCLDSNHTHDHVLAELEAYAPLTSKGSYCVVFDTFIEDLPDNMIPDRPWARGNSPKTAVWEYMKKLESGNISGSDRNTLRFEIDRSIDNKLLIAAAPDGFLRRI